MSSVLRTLLARRATLVATSARSVSRSATNFEKTPTNPTASKTTEAGSTEPAGSGNVNVLLGARTHAVNSLEKRFLVWSGKYKSIDEVPAAVSHESVEKARNKARIKIANYMILATIIACFAVVISGKNAQRRGESVQKMNLDWHRQIKEDALAEEAARGGPVSRGE